METTLSSPELDKMNPAELNVRFLELLDEIPQLETEEPEKSSWELNLKILLDHTPITQSFRNFIFEDLSEQFYAGHRSTEQWAQFYWPKIQEAGIFDPNQAQILDQDTYRYLFDDYRTILESVDKGSDPSSVLQEPYTVKKQEALKSWRQEFIQKHHEEP